MNNLIIGQGLAGSALAWTLYWSGQSVFIIDREEPNTASRVAAGLVTPMTGKRLVKAPEFDAYWSAAEIFYQKVEQETKSSLFAEADMIRLFENDDIRQQFLARSDEGVVFGTKPWNGRVQREGRRHYGVMLKPAARLKVPEYLESTKMFFKAKDGYVCQAIDLAADLDIAVDAVTVRCADVTADRIILCQGAVNSSELFPDVPNNPARGDILHVQIPRYMRTEVVHRSIWIAPGPDGTQKVGATYDWRNVNPAPTVTGRKELLGKLDRIIDGDVTVLGQVAGVRPTMKDYQPVIGSHPKHRNVFVFNGLGSKGTLRAPLLAAELTNMMNGIAQPREDRSYQRLLGNNAIKGTQRPLTAQAQEHITKYLNQGDTAIDATVGNGFDTCFLSKTVGKAGTVLGFDVQKSALTATSRRLEATGLENVRLMHQGHETLGEVAEKESVSAIMFNLGYLPRHDRGVITKPETSTRAIRAAFDVLKANGVITVLAYRGHEGGAEEYAQVARVLLSYAEDYDLRQINSVPAKPTSPVLFVLVKRPSDQEDKD